MKKILFAVIIAVSVVAVGCGPSKEELRKKFVADSTKKADSVAVIAKEAEAKAAAMKAEAEEAAKKAGMVAHEDSVKKGLIKAPAPEKSPKKGH
jgi:hypothetical protein